jgi:hypothetical protein
MSGTADFVHQVTAGPSGRGRCAGRCSFHRLVHGMEDRMFTFRMA